MRAANTREVDEWTRANRLSFDELTRDERQELRRPLLDAASFIRESQVAGI